MKFAGDERNTHKNDRLVVKIGDNLPSGSMSSGFSSGKCLLLFCTDEERLGKQVKYKCYYQISSTLLDLLVQQSLFADRVVAAAARTGLTAGLEETNEFYR